MRLGRAAYIVCIVVVVPGAARARRDVVVAVAVQRNQVLSRRVCAPRRPRRWAKRARFRVSGRVTLGTRCATAGKAGGTVHARASAVVTVVGMARKMASNTIAWNTW